MHSLKMSSVYFFFFSFLLDQVEHVFCPSNSEKACGMVNGAVNVVFEVLNQSVG